MDPIANVLTQIRNATAVKKSSCLVKHSKIVEGLLNILKKEKYIFDYKIEEKGAKKNIRISPFYSNGEATIHGIKRISKPGRRIYSSAEKLPRVLGGMGILIISTNRGLMTDKEARAQSLGGEIICEVY